MNNYLVSSCLAVLLVFSSSQGFAAGVGWLSNAPIRFFSEKDMQLMKDTVFSALSNNEDGVKSEWVNSETGHKGSITPINSKKIQGLNCRDVEMFNSAGGRTANPKYTFCQHEDGSWKFANK